MPTQAAKDGDTVRVRFVGRVKDGDVFGSTQNAEPIEFVLGEAKVVPGFRDAIIGMKPGEKKSVTLPPGEAFGEHREDKAADIPRKNLPDDFAPQVGQQVKLGDRGDAQLATVTEVGDEHVRVDTNHPLAGEDVVFEIELVDIVEPESGS